MTAAYRTSTTGGGTAGTGNRTATITTVAGDLIVVFVNVSVNTNDAPTCTDDQGGTYQRIGTRNNGTDSVAVFVGNALVVTGASTIVTPATGSNTAGNVVAVAVSGMTLAGLAAIRQVGIGNGATGTTPAPVFDVACLTGSVVLGVVATRVNPPTISPPSGWTERHDIGQATPATGLEVATRDSGETGTTITWGSTVGAAWQALIVELNTTASTPTSITVTDNQSLKVVSTTNTGPYTMTAWTPAANTLLVAIVMATNTLLDGTMSGGSLTWTLRKSSIETNTGQLVNIFTAPAGASPVSTAPSWTPAGGDPVSGCVVTAFELAGADTTTPVVQTQDSIYYNIFTTTTPSLTFASNLKLRSFILLAIINQERNPASETAPGYLTESVDTGYATPTTAAWVGYAAPSGVGNPSFSFTQTDFAHVVTGIEIAVSVAAAAVDDSMDPFGIMGFFGI